jgi:hypothetical protein
MRRLLTTLVMLVAIVSCGCCSDQPPNQPLVTSNPLDGKPDMSDTEHCGHVKVGPYSTDFMLDNGTQITLYLTGGTQPNLDEGVTGTLCVFAPDYHSPGERTYYFHGFKPDALKSNRGYSIDD